MGVGAVAQIGSLAAAEEAVVEEEEETPAPVLVVHFRYSNFRYSCSPLNFILYILPRKLIISQIEQIRNGTTPLLLHNNTDFAR